MIKSRLEKSITKIKAIDVQLKNIRKGNEHSAGMNKKDLLNIRYSLLHTINKLKKPASNDSIQELKQKWNK